MSKFETFIRYSSTIFGHNNHKIKGEQTLSQTIEKHNSNYSKHIKFGHKIITAILCGIFTQKVYAILPPILLFIFNPKNS